MEINKENYKQLAQCIYLGNLILNEYGKSGEERKEYSDFVNYVLLQIVKETPKTQSKFKFKNLPNEKTEDNMLSDLIDRIEDSVGEYYEEYRHLLFYEMLADRIADRNYPVIGSSEVDAFDNMLAKNLYFEILKSANESYVHIDAPKICDKILRAKRETIRLD